ncbi:MAG: hypothetical protein J0H72_24210 [Burkholderiales bacterium]|nr:hypothetical protein [Burkholderiales bacterium]
MLYFVYLRRPSRDSDLRRDPFWEFGSFGQTGCHGTNLMHPTRSPLTTGDRLVFLQGGKSEIRVVGLTPPIAVKRGQQPLNVTWDRGYRPLPYAMAPVFMDNSGDTDFPAAARILENTNRSTNCAKMASRLRSRNSPVDRDLQEQLLRWFSRDSLPTISHYLEAIDMVESKWVQHGLAAGWASTRERALRFAEASGVYPDVNESDKQALPIAKIGAARNSCKAADPQRKKLRTGCR